MAGILTDRLPRAHADVPAAESTSIRRVSRRHPIDLSETFKTTGNVIREGLLLFWMLAVVAFSLLLASGAMGFLV